MLALVVAVGGVGIGLAWRTNVLDKWLPNNVKEFFGKETTTSGEPTNGEEPANGENGEEPTADPTKDWKSYTNDKSGYSIKYPSDWIFMGNPYVMGIAVDFLVNSPSGSSVYTSAEEVASDSFSVWFRSFMPQDEQGNFYETTVGGAAAYRSYYSAPVAPVIFVDGPGSWILSIRYDRADGKEVDDKVFELVLETVKF